MQFSNNDPSERLKAVLICLLAAIGTILTVVSDLPPKGRVPVPGDLFWIALDCGLGYYIFRLAIASRAAPLRRFMLRTLLVGTAIYGVTGSYMEASGILCLAGCVYLAGTDPRGKRLYRPTPILTP